MCYTNVTIGQPHTKRYMVADWLWCSPLMQSMGLSIPRDGYWVETTSLPGEGYRVETTSLPGDGYWVETTSLPGDGYCVETTSLPGDGYWVETTSKYFTNRCSVHAIY